MAVSPRARNSRHAPLRSSIICLISVCSAILAVCPIGGWGEIAKADGAGTKPDDWITINKDYASRRYVDLDQITPRNVDKLQELCELRLNEPIVFSSGLLKVGRTLYVNTGHFTAAFDAVTCQVRWRKVIEFKPDSIPIGDNNRGSAYLDGKIFRGTVDGRLIALDATTGEILWDAHPTVQDPANGKLETFVAAPIAWQGKVFIGIGISDLAGTPGRLMAFDANTGEQQWSLNTTPGNPPAPSGGGFWTTYSLDPKTGEVFGPVANPFPDFNRGNPPDTDFTKLTDSVISVDTSSGKLNWYYQVVPLDDHDYDLSTAPTLYRTSKGQGGRNMIALVGKFGRVFGLDRDTQLLAFDTPATTLENDQEPLTSTWMHTCPGVNGGAQFTGAAYHPGLGALYAGMIDFCSWYAKGPNFGVEDLAGIGGATVKDWASAAKLQAPRGWVTAINGATGAVLWKYQAESQVQAGMVPTKSGLLFAGDTHGNLLVFNARTGELLRSIDTGGALNSGLISYEVSGQQYVAAASGGATENPSKLAGPLKVAVYGLYGSGKPNVVTLDRLQPPPGPLQTPEEAMFTANCGQCHASGGVGGSSPPLMRQSQLADPALLKQFLASAPPPMPHLYPGVLQDQDVEMIAKYLRTSVFNCDSTNPPPPQSCNPPSQPTSGGTQAWKAIYSDLTSPRCINCHPVKSPNLPTFPASWNNSTFPQDYPRQGDDRHPHYYTVLRGDTFAFETAEKTGTVYPGMGTPFERCTFCHGTKNDPVTGIPGTTNPEATDPTAAFWALAPATMAWESAPGVPLNGTQLCTALLDMSKNGNRTPAQLLHHIATEPLVAWSFNPGIGQNGKPRTTPPIPKDELINWFQIWIHEGTPCPSN